MSRKCEHASSLNHIALVDPLACARVSAQTKRGVGLEGQGWQGRGMRDMGNQVADAHQTGIMETMQIVGSGIANGEAQGGRRGGGCNVARQGTERIKNKRPKSKRNDRYAYSSKRLDKLRRTVNT